VHALSECIFGYARSKVHDKIKKKLMRAKRKQWQKGHKEQTKLEVFLINATCAKVCEDIYHDNFDNTKFLFEVSPKIKLNSKACFFNCLAGDSPFSKYVAVWPWKLGKVKPLIPVCSIFWFQPNRSQLYCLIRKRNYSRNRSWTNEWYEVINQFAEFGLHFKFQPPI